MLGRPITLYKSIDSEFTPIDNPFDHFLEASGGYLPSPMARWCTKKMKLEPFEQHIGDEPTISYVGIRGDENREGIFQQEKIFKRFSTLEKIFGVKMLLENSSGMIIFRM